MITIFILMMILLIIPIDLMAINLMLTKKSQSREKKSPFECEFDPLSMSRIPLSSQFFLIGLVFLVFDVEITMLLPLILLLSYYKTMYKYYYNYNIFHLNLNPSAFFRMFSTKYRMENLKLKLGIS